MFYGVSMSPASKKPTHFFMQCPICLFDFNQFGDYRQIFVKVPNNKFHVNSPSGRRTDACEQTDVRDESDYAYQGCAASLRVGLGLDG